MDQSFLFSKYDFSRQSVPAKDPGWQRFLDNASYEDFHCIFVPFNGATSTVGIIPLAAQTTQDTNLTNFPICFVFLSWQSL